MATIKRFEQITAWREARSLVKEIYRVTGAGAFGRDFGLRDQIRRAGVSIMSNIAEGFERGSNREFVQFLQMAKASSAEVRSHCYVAFDVGYFERDQFNQLRRQAESISGRIASFITYLRNSNLADQTRTRVVAEVRTNDYRVNGRALSEDTDEFANVDFPPDLVTEEETE